MGSQGRCRLSGTGRGAPVSLTEDPTEATERHGRSADRGNLSRSEYGRTAAQDVVAAGLATAGHATEPGRVAPLVSRV